MPTDPTSLPPCNRNFRPEGADSFPARRRGQEDGACVIQHGAYRGETVQAGVLTSGPYEGQRVGAGDWNGVVRNQCLPARVGLPNADLVRIEEQLLSVRPGSERVLVNGNVETPGNACFEMGDPQQAFDVIRQCSGGFSGPSDFCLGLFSGNARERAQAFLETYRAGYARNPLLRVDGDGRQIATPLPDPLLENILSALGEYAPELVGSIAGLIGVIMAFGVGVPWVQQWWGPSAHAAAASAGMEQAAAQTARSAIAGTGRSILGRVLTGLGNSIVRLGGVFFTPVIGIRSECGPDDSPAMWGITCSGGGA